MSDDDPRNAIKPATYPHVKRGADDEEDDAVEGVGDPHKPLRGTGPSMKARRACLTCEKPFTVGEKRGDTRQPYLGRYCEEHDARGGNWHDHPDHRDPSAEWPKSSYDG